MEQFITAFSEATQSMATAMSFMMGQLGTQLSEALVSTSTASVSLQQLQSVSVQLEELKKSNEEDRREKVETKALLKAIHELLMKE